jgi:hypothetical protein
LAYQLTANQGPLEPKVRQAILNGRKVVAASWRNGGVLRVPAVDSGLRET